MTITTEMLERAGCIIGHSMAYDVENNGCVAERCDDGNWRICCPDHWYKYKRRFRVKAKGV